MAFEGICRGLYFGDIGPPTGLGKDLIVVGSGCTVNELADDVGVTRMLRGLRDHPDKYRAQRRLALVLLPVGHQPWRVQFERRAACKFVRASWLSSVSSA